jgi:hypothetical protein
MYLRLNRYSVYLKAIPYTPKVFIQVDMYITSLSYTRNLVPFGEHLFINKCKDIVGL